MHKIKFTFLTILMCDNKYIQMVLQQSPPSVSEILSSFLSEAPHVLSNQLPAPHSYPLVATILASLSVNVTTIRTSYKWTHIAFVFVIGLLPLAWCLQDVSTLQPMSEFSSCLRLNNIPLCE